MKRLPAACGPFARSPVLGLRLCGFVVLLSVAIPVEAARPQFRTAVRPELRVDALGGEAPSVQIGVGAQRPVSLYARLAVIAAAGTAWDRGRQEPAGRVDLGGRFVLDPIDENRWTLYGAGGLSLRYDGFEGWRPLLNVGLGLQGPTRGRMAWGTEVGLGGGVRFGVALRWARGELR